MKLTTLCFFMIVSPRGVRDARLAFVDSIPSPERLIQDAHQREPLRGCRRPRPRTIARRADSAEPLGIVGPTSDRDRAADDVARHLVEIAIRREQHREPCLSVNPVSART